MVLIRVFFVFLQCFLKKNDILTLILLKNNTYSFENEDIYKQTDT